MAGKFGDRGTFMIGRLWGISFTIGSSGCFALGLFWAVCCACVLCMTTDLANTHGSLSLCCAVLGVAMAERFVRVTGW
jgi:hypothetical protein